MSKIGKLPITIPNGVSVEKKGGCLCVSGPKGSVCIKEENAIADDIKDGQIILCPKKSDRRSTTIWGTYRSLIANAVKGVTEGFSKTLEIEGVGFKASTENNELVLKIGFSHLVRFPFPDEIKIAVAGNKIKIEGIDKYLVGQTAANIRSMKKPEPYLGKGIKYEGEVIRRKAGKKAAGTTA